MAAIDDDDVFLLCLHEEDWNLYGLEICEIYTFETVCQRARKRCNFTGMYGNQTKK